MTANELREKIGLGPGELLDTNRGPLDILSVNGDKVTYGFLTEHSPITENIESFISRATYNI